MPKTVNVKKPLARALNIGRQRVIKTLLGQAQGHKRLARIVL